MNANAAYLIEKTAEYVRDTLSNAEAGHDWWHTLRVWRNTQHIAASEKVDALVVELAALLHDIADSKFHQGDESIGPRLAHDWLSRLQAPMPIVLHVVQIITYMPWKASIEGEPPFFSRELAVVQDADRLDAIGAIGIARAFSYGGFHGRPFYDPEHPPNLALTREQYKNSRAPTLNHFYEKLLRIKDHLHTHTARQIAAERHRFMEVYLEQFYREWKGEG